MPAAATAAAGRQVSASTTGHDRDQPDAIRARLIAAALRVFAAKGFEGTRILDIVREAGLSTGAVYGRFNSKIDLLREAVINGSRRAGRFETSGLGRVADLITRGAAVTTEPLTDEEAVRLEAFVAARRDPAVAAALAEAQSRFRAAVQPLVDTATADGTVATDVDPEAVLYLVRTIQLGLLLQRGAGAPAPDPAGWSELIDRIVASFGVQDPPRAAGRASEAQADQTDQTAHRLNKGEPQP